MSPKPAHADVTRNIYGPCFMTRFLGIGLPLTDGASIVGFASGYTWAP